MQSSLYAVARPSEVYPSVTMGGSVKTVEVRIMQYSSRSLTPLVFAGQPSSRNSDGFPERGRQTSVGWENKLFSSIMCQYLEICTRYVQSYYYSDTYSLSIDTKIDDLG